MSKWKMPPVDHPVHAMIRDTDFAALTAARVAKLPTMSQARAHARDAFRIGPSVNAYTALVLRDDGAIVLKTFGRRGGHRTRWNFGFFPTPPSAIDEELRQLMAVV